MQGSASFCELSEVELGNDCQQAGLSSGRTLDIMVRTLESWSKGWYLQSRARDTDLENKHGDTQRGRGGRVEMDWQISTDTYTVLDTKQVTGENLPPATGHSAQRCVGTWTGRKSKTEGMCGHTADSLCCPAL